MSKLTLTILDSDNAALSVTEHETLTEALNEYAGWGTQGAAHYMVQGTMSLDCACKRTMESRNRVISIGITMSVVRNGNATDAGARVEVKAPQACKFLSSLPFPASDMPEVEVCITDTVFNIG